MLTQFPYVFATEFLFQGRKTVDTHFADGIIEHEIVEVDGQDAPVVARWRETFMDEVMYGDPLGGHGVEFERRSIDVEVRHFGGHLYVPLSLLHDSARYGGLVGTGALPGKRWYDYTLEQLGKAELFSQLHPGSRSRSGTTEFLEYSGTRDLLGGDWPRPPDLPKSGRTLVEARSRQAVVATVLKARLSGLLAIDGSLWGQCAQPRLVSRMSGPREGDVFVLLTDTPLRRFGGLGLPDEDRVSGLTEDMSRGRKGNLARRVEDVFVSDASLFEFDIAGEALSRTARHVLDILEPGLGGMEHDAITALLEVREALSVSCGGGGNSRLDNALRRLGEFGADAASLEDMVRVRASLDAIGPVPSEHEATPGPKP